jgi:hypothetical protein
MWLLCTICSRYLQQWSILPCTDKSSNWKHRKGSCGGGVGVYHVQPTVQLEAARKGSCGTDRQLWGIGKPFDMLQSWSKHEFKCRYRHLSASCETYNPGSQGGAAKVPKATDIWEKAFHELKLTKHAEGPLDVKRASVSFLPTRSGILNTYLSCTLSGCVFDMQPVSGLIVAHNPSIWC